MTLYLKIKIKLLQSDQKRLRHGSSTKPLSSLCKEIRKKYFGGKINLLWNSAHLDKNNDVKHNTFRCLILLISVEQFSTNFDIYYNMLDKIIGPGV